jgi:hypothetical protein
MTASSKVHVKLIYKTMKAALTVSQSAYGKDFFNRDNKTI